MSLISMAGAWLSFSDAPLLDNAQLHIELNERVCLVGRNGAGKSTLLKVLNKEIPLDDGRLTYEQDLVVSRLQQDPPQDVEGTVFDFVSLDKFEKFRPGYLRCINALAYSELLEPCWRNSSHNCQSTPSTRKFVRNSFTEQI